MTDESGLPGPDRDEKLPRISSLLTEIEEALSSQIALVGQGRLAETEEISPRVTGLMLQLKGLSRSPFPFPDRLARLGERQRLLVLTMEQQKQTVAQELRKMRTGRKLVKAYSRPW